MRYSRLKLSSLGLFFTVMLVSVSAFQVDISVKETLKPEISVVDRSLSERAPKSLDIEAHNRGSLPFVGRLRLDVLHKNKKVFRIWSDTMSLESGSFEKETLRFYRPDLNGTLIARPVLDYGLDQIEGEEVRFNTRETEYKKGFNISSAEAYEEYIYIEFESPADVESVVVSLWGESTRKYVQEKIEVSGGGSSVKVRYHPPIEEEERIKASLNSIEGKYSHTESLEIQHKEGFSLFFHKLGVLLGGVF